MKCKNNVDGKVCGEDIPPSSKFCGICGGKVLTEDDNTTKACPKCSFLITNRQKFCSGCAWKIDPSIFLQKKIFCQGLTPENKICGVELSPDVKFCCECGTVQRIPTGETQQKVSEPVREVKVDELMKDELPQRQPHESSGSGSSSRSESPDTWRLPDIPISTPDPSCEDNEIHASGEPHLPLRSIGEHTSEENEETADSGYLQEKGREMRDSSTCSYEENVENSGDLEMEATLSSATDTVNNNVTEPTPSQETMETEPNIEGGNSWTWNTENSQTLSYENRSTLTLAVTGSSVIKPHPFTLPSSNTAPLDGVPSEPERETTGTEQMEENSGNPPEEIPAHDMGTGSKQPSQGKGKVQELTKKFESTVTIENSGNNHEPNKGSPDLKREISHSSAGSELGSDEDNSSSDEDDDDNEDPKKEQTTGSKGAKKKPKGAKEKRQKKKERKERNKKRKLNLPETEPGTEDRDTTMATTSKKDTTSSKKEEANKQVDNAFKQKDESTKQKEVTLSEMSNDKKQQEKDKPYNTRSTAPGNISQNDKETTNLEKIDEKKTENEKPYNTRSTTQGKETQQNLNTNSTQTNKNTGDGKSTQENKGSANKSNVGSKKVEFAEVYFHIIVSPTLLHDAQKGDVHVSFQSTTLGGWKCKKHKLNFKRIHADGHLEYEGVVKIPKDILVTRLYYCYYVVKSGNEIIEEYIYCHSSEAKHRTMSVEHGKMRDTLHQFDGVIKEKVEKDKNKGMIKTIKGLFGVDDYKKELKKEAAFAFQAMAPQIQMSMKETTGVTGEEIIFYVESLLEGLDSAYRVTAGLWYTGREFLSYMSKEIHNFIAGQLNRLYEKKKSKVEEEDHVLHLSAAIAFICLKDTYGVQLTDVEDDNLCRALLPILNERKQCPEFEGLKDYFPKTRKRITSSLLKIVRQFASDTNKSCMFFCIPLLHYLFDKYTPYQAALPRVNHEDTKPEWWGTAEFDDQLKMFKGKSKWDRKRSELVQLLSPYFEMDYLFPRTFLACVNFYHVTEVLNLELLPPDAVLATICYLIKSSSYSSNFVSKETATGAIKTFEKLSSILVKLGQDSNLTIETPLRNYKIAGNILDCLGTKYVSDNYKPFLCISIAEVFFISVEWFAKCLKIRQAQGKNGTYTDHLLCFDKHRERLKNIMINEHYYGYEEHFLRIWNRALEVKIPDGEIRETYIKFLRDELEQTLTTRSSHAEGKLVELYCENVESFCDPIQEILSKLAFRAVERGNSLHVSSSYKGSMLMKYGKLLSLVFERSMDLHQLVDQHKILDYTLNWAPFATYVKLLYHDEYSKSLSSNSADLMRNFVEVLKRASEALSRGNILVQDLQRIMGKAGHFKSIVMEIKDLPIKAEYLMASLPLREKELLAYQATLKIVQDFMYMCTRFKGNTRDLEDRIKRFEKLENVSLNMLCKVAFLEDMKNHEQYEPTITAFGLDENVFQTIPYILKCGQGLLFITLWDRRGNELAKQKGKSLDLDEILTEVWEPTYKFWDDLCTRLKNGDLKFSEFEKFFKTTDMETLRNELMKLCQDGNTKWIDVRLDQLEKYRNLQSCLFGARAIMEVVKEFELTGNFNQILEILKLTGDADTKMNTLDDNMMKTCKILTGIDEDKAKSLRTFIACKPLVVWLRETMPSGLKELKVFVDLASISAGEGDYEIDKVNCLHSATTGYSPLIFSLDQDCDAALFLHRCEEVWKELKADSKLPKKLVDTQRQLDWLKSVKQTHGSVEVTSLAQAEAINTNGIYQVGNLKKTATIKNPTLGEVLELRVTETEGQRLQRNQYKYEQLHDLQSRLMLVAGKAEKGKDDVDRFMLILDSVVRLGNIYTKLVAEGCVLFSQWHVKFLCDRTRKACAFINFGFGEDKHTLKGRIDDTNEDVSSIIPKLAKFLEQCHKKWLDYIDERREKYYLLNFFTVDQMVILQQELVKLGTEVEPSVLIFPMLSAVKQGCTKEDLVRAMSSAKEDVDKLDSQREEQMEEENQAEAMDAENEADDVKISKFLEVMTKSYPIELVREALKHVSPDDIDEGLVWCMDNEETFIPEEQGRQSPVMTEPIEKEINYTGWTQTGQSLASITASLVSQLDVESKENSVDKLVKALEDLWNTFLNSISSSVLDYLSVEHLGLILNRLAEQEKMVVDRTFLPSFKAGEPNLIICPQSEIYNTVLSVYSHEDDRPLPQSDEVLLCTPQTTLDMIEIFWRRSLFANNSKVHCLVNADLLDYDVSDRGERTLERLMKNAESKGMKYRLVVICSSENEYKSRVVAALDKYHRPQLPIDVPNVRKYLLTKLKVEKSTTGVRPASAVDFERCSVRVVKSWRAGVGKTLYKKRMVADLYKLVPNIPRRMSSNVTIPLHEKAISTNDIMDIFLQETLPPRCHEPRIFHIDISHEVQEGVDAFLFQLLILGCLGHSSGHVWRRLDVDYYIIESMPLLARSTDAKLKCLHHCLDILPHVMCRSPQESLEILTDVRRPPDYTDHDRLFDGIEFKSPTFQRPYQYLKRLDTNCRLDDVNANIPEEDKKQCLNTLLRHCGIRDPSWSELHHFVSFLNKQLQDFEVSAFCGLAAVEDLPGFAKFVLRFLIQMSRDFSTRSLKVSEESPIQMLQRQISDEEEENKDDDNVIQLYQMRRTWETSPHPYLFFNPDHHSMTFLGFNIDRRTGNLIDLQTRNVLEEGIMQQNLFDALVRNRVNLAENFDALPRHEKILKLCNVMGLDMAHDPDDTYELTTDNVKKILAIYMRFRCDIPVIIMGETGCGKTRLIKFMCSLQQPPGATVDNMILMKVHGGTKVSDIKRKVRKAEEMARKNAADYPFMDTVLFFDEANTTEAIGVIKEIMCDRSLEGKPIKLHEKLKIVAACNPYRKHSDELIKRLEQAGLGYHVDADKTTDKLGRVPMRRLVYRVQPLPQSMLPLVWDFGQLNTEVEEMYIRQMVLRYTKNQKLPAIQGLEDVVSKVLTVSQDFMRNQKDECSFVSLRDVERVLEVMSWFHRQSEDDNSLFQKMNQDSDYSDAESEEETMEVEQPQQQMDEVTRSLVLALGVCYHACLKNRDEYRETVAPYFRPPLQLPGGAEQIEEEITKCQKVFLDSVELAENIARNQALKENVFMMVVCIELRIPMFLVGKPGSSKSLAKTIVADAMQGNAAHKALFKNYKQRKLVKSLFGGVLTNNVVSLDCPHVSRTLEEFYTVRCQVTDMKNLNESLDEVTVKDMLEGDNMYTCSKCQKKVRAEKRACFKRLPRILCFNTMRYTFNMVTMLKEKVNTHFSFPLRLDMSQYMEKNLMGPDKLKDDDEDDKMQILGEYEDNDSYDYELIGVTVHTGTADGGHYYSFIRDRLHKSENGQDKWYLFNDAEVKSFDPSQIAQECFGGEMTSKTYDSVTDKFMDFSFEKTNSAYMLFYERCSPRPEDEKKLDLVEQTIDQPKFNFELTKELEEWIWQDNTQFLQDKNILDHTYFGFMWQICGYIPTTLPKDPENLVSLNAAQLSTSFVLETLIHAKEKPTMLQWIELLTKQFNSCPGACEWFLDHMAESDWWPQQILIKCPNQMVRQMFQRLLIHVITQLRSSHEDLYLVPLIEGEDGEIDVAELGSKSCVTRFIKKMLSIIEHGVRPHSKYLTEYFAFLLEFAKMGDEECIFMIHINAISTMINFYLGQKAQENYVEIPSDDEDDEVITITDDAYKPLSLEKMITLIAVLVEKSRGEDKQLHISDKDYSAIIGGKGFPFLFNQIRDAINLRQTCNLIFSLSRWNEQLAVAIVTMVFSAIKKLSIEHSQPFFKLLSMLVEFGGGPPGLPPFTQYCLQRFWDLTKSCPQPCLEWMSSQVTRNKLASHWILNQRESWVEPYLIANNNARVRNAAAMLLISLVPSNHFRQTFRATRSIVSPHKESAMSSEAVIVLHQIYEHLLSLLSRAKLYVDPQAHGTSKLTSYFAVMSYCLISRTEKLMFGRLFQDLWNLFQPKLCEPQISMHHNKQALMYFWYQACVDCPENIMKIVSNPNVCKQIAYNYILADHDDQDVLMFNRIMLPSYYGLLRMCCQQSRVFTRQLASHQNINWAFQNIAPYPTKYAAAVDELFKMMRLMATKYSDSSEEEVRSINSFKKNTSQMFLNMLDARSGWQTLISVLKILVDTDNDRLFLIYQGGLQMMSEAFNNLHVMYHEATACHVTGDIVDLLTIILPVLKVLRHFHDKKSSGSDIQTVFQNWRDRMEFVKKLLTLLNSFTPPEIRQISIEVLREMVIIFQSECVHTMVPMLTQAHVSFQESNLPVPTPGPYFPRRGQKPIGSKSNIRPPRPQFNMMLHSSQVEATKGVDENYDCALSEFFLPYHSLVDLICRVAVNQQILNEHIINLSAVVAVEGVPLHSAFFAKLWYEIYHSEVDRNCIRILCSSSYFIEYVDSVLLDERLSLNNHNIYQFFCNFFPKVYQQVLNDQGKSLLDSLVASVTAEKSAIENVRYQQDLLNICERINGDLRAMLLIFSVQPPKKMNPLLMDSLHYILSICRENQQQRAEAARIQSRKRSGSESQEELTDSTEATPSKKRRVSGKDSADEAEDRDSSSDVEIIPDDTPPKKEEVKSPEKEEQKVSSGENSESDTKIQESSSQSDSEKPGPSTSKDSKDSKEEESSDSKEPENETEKESEEKVERQNSSESRHSSDEVPRQKERPTIVDLVAKQIDSIFSLIEKH
ncbi:ubiquitin carboxyl-terminal hydrolase 34 [Mytilus galloprovincialis]|uniref:Ubiquitin carboxyl-terminal hydrolase 34 n=1 Tax=Mytilus galloprovincialis TaxID=29158 RepID=A0A8B6BPL3_MYTGA|nr:ubiquitin carboxyl-terminal hydrolase 34 [Mytilus galloprovincialis]